MAIGSTTGRRRHTPTPRISFLAEGSLTGGAIGASPHCLQHFSRADDRDVRQRIQNGVWPFLPTSGWRCYADCGGGVLPAHLPAKQDLYDAQFCGSGYNNTVAMIMAIFWLTVHMSLTLTSILFLGARL